MKNTEHTGAARRPNLPATGSAQRKKAPEPVAHIRYVMKALRSTAVAFMAPTVVAPLLPAPLKPWRLVVSGLLYADQHQQPLLGRGLERCQRFPDLAAICLVVARGRGFDGEAIHSLTSRLRGRSASCCSPTNGFRRSCAWPATCCRRASRYLPSGIRAPH